MMNINHKLIMNEVEDYFFITLGLVLYTIAFTVFLMPYQIVAGGVTGLSAIIYYERVCRLSSTMPQDSIWRTPTSSSTAFCCWWR